MDLEQKPSWSKGDLRRLGETLVIDKAATPDGCPQYGEVMRWHNELATEVAIRIATELWVTTPPGQLSITARPKTIDTLVQKLQRTTLKLGQVQDLAGVRVDADMLLTQQTSLAHEIAEYFGAARATIKDLRKTPHSGYRAVHVWLVLPAGRVEVQIRTLAQSEWANAFEEIAELVGRGIRYGEKHEDALVRKAVDEMHERSESLALHEEVIALNWELQRASEELSALDPPGSPVTEDSMRTAEVLEQGRSFIEKYSEAIPIIRSQLEHRIQRLREFRRRLNEEEEEEEV
jgi:ppGpp synthetase/RelA/SpoT-type nucleotidyltranferase